MHSAKELKDMYAKKGRFYIDVDERHEIMFFLLLIFVLFVLLAFRKILVEVTQNSFESEYSLTIGKLYSLPELLKKEKEED